MRIEIDLVTDVADVEDLDIVLDQSQRDDQGREPVMVISAHTQQRCFLVSAESCFEIPHQGLEYVHVLAHRRLHSQCFHEEFPIPAGEFLGPVLMGLTDQPPEDHILLRVMGQQQVLVDRMELYQSLPRDPTLDEILPTAVTENSLNKVLPERRVTEPSFLLDRNQWKLLHKSPCKESDSLSTDHSMLM